MLMLGEDEYVGWRGRGCTTRNRSQCNCNRESTRASMPAGRSTTTDPSVFRPPYGRISPHQARILQNHFQIVMWDVLSGDFDLNIDKETCFQNVIKNASEGSIIVFHDSLKSKEKLNYALPKVLEYYSNLGYRFERI